MTSFDELLSQVQSAKVKDEESQNQVHAASDSVTETGSQVGAARATAEQLSQRFAALGAEGTAQRTRAVTSRLEGMQARMSGVGDGLGSANTELASIAAELAEVLTEIQAIQGLLAGSTGVPEAEKSSPKPPGTAAVPVDPQWGRQTQSGLHSWRAGQPTVGYSVVHGDGIMHLVRSGAEADGTDAALARFMIGRNLVPAYMTRPEASKHAELKTAFRQRASGSATVELAINKPVDTDQFGCDKLLPYVLRPGQTLIIHDPEGIKTYRGIDGN